MNKLILMITLSISVFSALTIVNSSQHITPHTICEPEEILDYSNNFIKIEQYEMSEICKQLQAKSNIKVLNLSHNKLKNESVFILADFLKDSNNSPNLNVLDLSYNEIEKEGITAFAPLMLRPNFKYLAIHGAGNCSSNFMVNSMREELKKLFDNKAVSQGITARSKSLDRKEIVDQKLVWIPPYRTTLNRLQSEGIISKTQQQTHMKYLAVMQKTDLLMLKNVSYEEIRKEGGFSSVFLRDVLSIYHTDDTDQLSSKEINDLIKSNYLTKLQSLSLRGQKISDDHINEIANNKTFARIKTLDLSNTNITDQAIDYIKDSIHLGSIRDVRQISERFKLPSSAITVIAEKNSINNRELNRRVKKDFSIRYLPPTPNIFFKAPLPDIGVKIIELQV